MTKILTVCLFFSQSAMCLSSLSQLNELFKSRIQSDLWHDGVIVTNAKTKKDQARHNNLNFYREVKAWDEILIPLESLESLEVN